MSMCGHKWRVWATYSWRICAILPLMKMNGAISANKDNPVSYKDTFSWPDALQWQSAYMRMKWNVTSCNTLMTFSDKLWPSSKLSSHHSPLTSSHPHKPFHLPCKPCHTQVNSITPMHIMQCSHEHWPILTLRHSQAPTQFPTGNNIPCIYCHAPTPTLVSISCKLPSHHHPHIITLTSSPSHHHPHIITLTSSPSHHHPHIPSSIDIAVLCF